jgi:dTDP-4-amino-4,6-dideoxygalactose transaminase
MRSIDKIIIPYEMTIQNALSVLNESDLLILFIVNSDGALERTITDGDLRRFVLDKGSLGGSVDELPEKPPIVVTSDALNNEVSTLMYRHGINHVPVVDATGRPIGIHTRESADTGILLSVPHMTGEEREYVEQAFDTNWVAPLGPNVDAFEQELSEYIGGSYVAAVNTGTAAIHLALRLLEVSTGDFIFCQSFTFIASANPIVYQGAEPVFIDSESKTWNMCPIALKKALQHFKKLGKLPKAIIVVHIYGQSADMDKIMKISDEYGVPVVEDAAESMGASYKGKHTGIIGKFGIFSFNGNKIITTSGGGALVSDDKEMIKKARFLSTQAKDPEPHYEHTEIGYNYRMSNILAGVGRGQLKVLDDRVLARRKIFQYYKTKLSEIDAIEWMPEPSKCYSNRWLSAFIINPDKTNITNNKLIEFLSELNIEARHVWKPMHQQPVFSGLQYFMEGRESYCDYLFDNGICLPSSSSMTNEQQDFVVSAIINFFQNEY